MEKIYAQFDRLTYDRNQDIEITFKVKGYVNKTLATQLQEQTVYRLDIKEAKSQRTHQQNSFMWALIHDISVARNTDRATNDDDWDIYIEALERAQAKFEYFQCRKQALEMLKESFRAVKVLNEFTNEKGFEMVTIKAFYGSSTMDISEMAHLLDTVIDMAEESGVPVQEQMWSY